MYFAERLILNVGMPYNISVTFYYVLLFLLACSISTAHADIIPPFTVQIIEYTQLITLGSRLPVINVQCFIGD